ncbi:hypothetical protein ONE63_001240 [Megalurothrips usitatus]|uniref:Serine protease K12H4.7 n=1 Tax=Megalurothrips usitatus TaxID=439358 RepID=A0AAV7XF83_9NEOP|nr:hypothetical protein ONE63_001240 [Megalurothrips usitatus]
MAALQAALLLLFGLALAALAPSEQATLSRRLPLVHDHIAFSRSLRSLRYVPPPPKVTRAVPAKVDTFHLDQVLDHFNPVDKTTWKQRYFARTDLYEEGGPVFIYIGGEGAESTDTLDDGVLFMTYLAENFKAKLYDLEHRYYGGSHPTPDLSSANLQYLSADQALADLAYFIETLIEKGEIEKDQKVAVFGGSYPGNLAAWARIKYPHLVHAAVSSSAPVYAEADFIEYMQVVAKSLDKVAGTFCGENIKKATDRIVQLLKTTDGYEQVKETFQVGTDLKDKLDLDAFFETLSNPFAGAVQYNRDVPYSPYSIKYICSSMAGDNLTGDQAMEQLSALVLGSSKGTGQMFDWSYQSSVTSYQSTQYQGASKHRAAVRQWLYQTCTEFGYYQTFSGDGTPFPKAYNDLAYDYQLCKDIFGDAYDKAVVDGGVRRSNIVFGERHPDVTNVIFVNGDIDPWHALGILEDVSPQAPAAFVDGGSHCADMNYPDPDSDSASIIAVHDKVHKFLRSALYEVPSGGPADG